MRLLLSDFKLLPSRETIRRWNVGKTAPMTSVNKFDAEPSEELSFFLGAWLGDGWGDSADGGKRLFLKVRARQFAEEFANSATSILHKSIPYVARRIEDENGTWYQVKVTSLLLFELANRPFGDLTSCIGAHPIGFLRGFFTAEGNPSVSIGRGRGRPALQVTLCVSNTEKKYIRYAMKLVRQLGYRPTNITKGSTPGLQMSIGIHSFITTKTEWQFRIARVGEVESFLMKIGFADTMKQEKAQTAVHLIKEFGSHLAAVEWSSMYSKIGRKWARRDARAQLPISAS